MSGSYTMVTSLEDLLGRLLVASERKITEYNDPDEGIQMLGLPPAANATNEELDRLKPLYIRLLQKDNAELLNRLEESEDQAILLLYFLEYPLLVCNSRGDETGMARCTSNEAFEMTEIARRILKNATILAFCRKVITSEGRPKTSSLRTSGVSILSQVNDGAGVLHETTAKKLIRRYIFQGEPNDDQGFQELRDDLGDVLAADPHPHGQLVANTIMLQINVLRTLQGEDQAIQVMKRAPNREVFEQALFRAKDHLEDEGVFQTFRMMIGCPTNPMELMSATQAIDNSTNRDATKPVYVCGNAGCTNQTSKRCDRCKLIGYCSRECQVQDWKAGHKKVCNSKTRVKNRKVEASAEATRKMASPALMRQENLLKKHPNCDYVLVLPSGNKDYGIVIAHPLGKIAFQVARSKAPEEPSCVKRMYQMLGDTHPNYRQFIRKQLQAEYGVDPESEEVMNAPPIKCTAEDIKGMVESW